MKVLMNEFFSTNWNTSASLFQFLLNTDHHCPLPSLFAFAASSVATSITGTTGSFFASSSDTLEKQGCEDSYSEKERGKKKKRQQKTFFLTASTSQLCNSSTSVTV
jgi:hypothetical protein